MTEAQVAVLLSDGRVLVWKLTDVSYQVCDEYDEICPGFCLSIGVIANTKAK